MLTLFAQVLVSGVLLVAGTAKVRDGGAALATTVAELLPIRRATATQLARVIIGAELVIAGSVWWPYPRLGLAAAAVLLLSFAAVAFHQAGRPTRIHCRCFGRPDSTLGTAAGIRNVVLVVIAAAGAAVASPLTAVPAVGVALTVVGAVIGVAVVVFLDDLTDLARA